MDDFRSSGSGTIDWVTNEWAGLYDSPQRFQSDALAGIAITSAVSENENERRILRGSFLRFFVERLIAGATRLSAEAFLQGLPRAKRLPTVAVDGDGGLLLAWTLEGRGRTLVGLSETTLYAVENAGTLHAQYLPEAAFDGAIPAEVLAAIPD